MWVYYDGPGASTFSINSKARPGEKIRIAPMVPTWLVEGDGWVLSLPHIHALMVDCWEIDHILPAIEDETYLPLPQGAWLLGLVAHLPDPAYIVEIGTGKGCSLIRILCGLVMHRDAHVWSIDLEEKLEVPIKIAETGVPAVRYDLLVGESAELGQSWKVPLNMVYFDGSHSEDGTSRDIIAWGQHIGKKGIAVFDDYGNPLHPGVQMAVDRLMVGNWMCIGQVGTMIAFRRD